MSYRKQPSAPTKETDAAATASKATHLISYSTKSKDWTGLDNRRETDKEEAVQRICVLYSPQILQRRIS